MEITGIVIVKPQIVTGSSSRGEWKKQVIVVEARDEYKRNVAIEFWGDNASAAANIAVGATVTISFNPESREHNGNWYTTLRGWKFNTNSTSAYTPPADSMLATRRRSR